MPPFDTEPNDADRLRRCPRCRSALPPPFQLDDLQSYMTFCQACGGLVANAQVADDEERLG